MAIASYQKSLLLSLALLTSAAGAVVFGRLADKLGRKKVYGYEMLVLAAGAIASACAPGIWWLIAFRGILGFGIGGDYPVSATIMSECASRHDRGRMVSLVFSMQGAGLVIGPLVAIGLLKAGLHPDLAWRAMLALGAVPALAVFWLRRRLRETPRFLLAQAETAGTGQPAGIRGVLAEPRLRRWLAGASLAWLLFDFAYYGNTISSPMIVKLVSPHASLIGATAVTLAIFAVAALPGYLLAAFAIDRIGRKLMQAGRFAIIAAAFAACGSSRRPPRPCCRSFCYSTRPISSPSSGPTPPPSSTRPRSSRSGSGPRATASPPRPESSARSPAPTR